MRLQRLEPHISLEPPAEWPCLCLWRAVDGASLPEAHQQAKCHDGPHRPQGQGNLG